MNGPFVAEKAIGPVAEALVANLRVDNVPLRETNTRLTEQQLDDLETANILLRRYMKGASRSHLLSAKHLHAAARLSSLERMVGAQKGWRGAPAGVGEPPLHRYG